MRKHTALMAALVMGVGMSNGAIAAGPDTQKCGSFQGKAAATLYAAFLRESARACGKAETGGAGATAVRHAAAAKIAGSFDSKLGSGVDKYNLDVDADLDFDDMGDQDNCPFDIGTVGGDDVLSAAQTIAHQACTP